MNFINKINNEIKNIFNNFAKNENIFLIPGFYHEKAIKENSDILFVGLNPAGKEFEEINKDNLINEEKIKNLIEIEENYFESYTYYETIHNFASEIDINQKYSICDLYQYRETNSKILEKRIEDNESFFEKQYEKIFLEIIKFTNPKLIVFLNGFASKKIKCKLFGNKRQKINLEKGYWEGDFNGKKIKILFSSMLSGQRALDIGSREILKYNIYKILK